MSLSLDFLKRFLRWALSLFLLSSTLSNLVSRVSGQGLAVSGGLLIASSRSVPRSADVSVGFSQSFSNDAATEGGLLVFSTQRGDLLRNEQGDSVSGSTLFLNPSVDFRPGETVFATSPTAMQSTPGDQLTRGHVYDFTTGVSGSGRGNFSAPPNPSVARYMPGRYRVAWHWGMWTAMAIWIWW